MTRYAWVALLILALGCGSEAHALTLLQQHGRALAEKMCAQCHAVGRSGESPRAGAPPFRALDRRLDLDSFAGRLREGLASSHPDMPMFRFSREDAKAVVAYLRVIQGR
jgi:cytochrome c